MSKPPSPLILRRPMPEVLEVKETKPEPATGDVKKLKYVKDGRYTFKSSDDYVQVLEPLRMKVGVNQQGEAEKVIYNQDKSLRITFKYCTFEATPELADTLGVDHQRLVETMLASKSCGRSYHLVSAPGFEPPPSLVAWMTEVNRRADVRLPVSTVGIKTR